MAVDRSVSNSGFSLLERSGRFHWPQASPLSCLVTQLWIAVVFAFQRDIALSPALRGYRFLILKGGTARFATESRLPPSGLVAQGY